MTTDSEKRGGAGFATAITASNSIMSTMKKVLPASARYFLGEKSKANSPVTTVTAMMQIEAAQAARALT